MKKSDTFRQDIRLLIRHLGLLDKVAHTTHDTLTLPQCHAIVEIGRYGGISLKDLAVILSIDVSTTSRTVEGLVKKGFALRKSSDTDRRAIEITLSEDGQSLFNKIETSMSFYYSKVFQNIPEEKQDQVLESLNLILEALSTERNDICNEACRKSK